jgi:outer membrane protein TolC
MLKRIGFYLLACLLLGYGHQALCAPSQNTAPSSTQVQRQGTVHPLTLDEIINLAVQKSPAVKAAKSQVEALESKSGGVSSSYLPEFRAQYWYNTNPVFGEVDNGFSSIEQHTDVGVRFPLLKQFGLKPGELKKVKLEIKVAHQELLRTIQATKWQIRNLYFDLWGSDQLKKEYQKMIKLIEEAKQLTQIGSRQKEVLPADRLAIEEQLTDVQQHASLAARAHETRKILLARLIGVPPASLQLAPYVPGAKKLPPFPELLNIAKKARPDMAIPEFKAQHAKIDGAYAPFNYLEFHADAYYNVDQYKILGIRTGALLGVHLTGPLAIFSLTKHRRQQSQHEAEAWEDKGQDMLQSVEQQLLIALEKYQNIEARLKIMAQKSKLAREKVRSKEILIKEPSILGSTSSLDLIMAQCQLLSVQSENISLKTEQEKAYYYLTYVLGTDKFKEDPSIRNMSKTISNTVPLAFWVYNTGQLITEPKLEDFFHALKSNDVKKLFFSIDRRIIKAIKTHHSDLTNFITKAHGQGIAVEALLDEPTWLLPINRSSLASFVRAIQAYNLQAPLAARFQALHLDLEINQLPHWQDRKNEVAGYLVDTIRAIRSMGTGLPLVVDLPIWLNRHGIKDWPEIIMAADRIVFLAYEQKTPHQLLNAFKPELLFCQQQHKPVWIGLDLHDFAGKGEKNLFDYIQQVNQGINLRVAGFALFQLADFQKLNY